MRFLFLTLAIVVASCSGGNGIAGSGDADGSKGEEGFGQDRVFAGDTTVQELNIPEGVTITVVGPTTIRIVGEATIYGTIEGDCVPLSILGESSVLVSGSIDNSCSVLPESVDPPPLTIVADGNLEIDGTGGKRISTSGETVIKNDPNLEESDFEESSESGSLEPAQAGALVLKNATFVKRPEKARDGANGSNGADAKSFRMVGRGDIRISGMVRVFGQAGGDGGNRTVTGTGPTTARGGRGGDGGRVGVWFTGTVAFEPGSKLEVVMGSGGRGGEATASAIPRAVGEKAPNAHAIGGDGGKPGKLIFVGTTQGVFDLRPGALEINLGEGGRGGDATARGAAGSQICSTAGRAQGGGDAEAEAGKGGHAGLPGSRIVEIPVVLGLGNVSITGGNGGPGGEARAVGGRGNDGYDCQKCKHGGHGGKIEARGGDGGSARIVGLRGEVVGRGGDGGDARFESGRGGDGADCCTSVVGSGGNGGSGGVANGMAGSGGTGGVGGAGVDGNMSFDQAGNGGNAGDGAGPGKPGAGDPFSAANGGVGSGSSGLSGQFCPTLTIIGNGSGTGTVTSSPAGITCTIDGGVATGDCDEAYALGTMVTLTAMQAEGSTFVGWVGGGCAGTSPCTVTMDQTQTVTAAFERMEVSLTVLGDGGGAGTVTSSPPGVGCTIDGGVATGDCDEAYAFGTMATLMAMPAAGSVFVGWAGGGCSGTSPCTVTMDQARTVTAVFELETTIDLRSTNDDGAIENEVFNPLVESFSQDNSIWFRVTVTNYSSDATGTGVVVTDQLVANLSNFNSIRSGFPTQGMISNQSGMGFTWTVGSLAPGQSAEIQFETFANGPQNGLGNTVTVQADQLSQAVVVQEDTVVN